MYFIGKSSRVFFVFYESLWKNENVKIDKLHCVNTYCYYYYRIIVYYYRIICAAVKSPIGGGHGDRALDFPAILSRRQRRWRWKPRKILDVLHAYANFTRAHVFKLYFSFYRVAELLGATLKLMVLCCIAENFKSNRSQILPFFIRL